MTSGSLALHGTSLNASASSMPLHSGRQLRNSQTMARPSGRDTRTAHIPAGPCQASLGDDGVVAGVGICLQVAVEAAEELRRPLLISAMGEVEDDLSSVANVGPEEAATTAIRMRLVEDSDAGVVALDRLRLQDRRIHRGDHRRQHQRRVLDPVAQGRLGDLDTAPREDLRLSMQRLMVLVLPGDDLGDEASRRHPSFDGVLRLLGSPDAGLLVVLTGVLHDLRFEDAANSWHVVDALSPILADCGRVPLRQLGDARQKKTTHLALLALQSNRNTPFSATTLLG
jgi:hypothetical protein